MHQDPQSQSPETHAENAMDCLDLARSMEGGRLTRAEVFARASTEASLALYRLLEQWLPMLKGREK